MSLLSVLLITTDPDVVTAFQSTAAAARMDLNLACCLESAARLLVRKPFDVLLLDTGIGGKGIGQHGSNGREIMRQPPVVAFSKKGSISEAVKAIRAGACDYLSKLPHSPGALRRVVNNALACAHDQVTGSALTVDVGMPFEGLVTKDHRMLAVCRAAARIADSRTILIIEGERGTGKSFLARKLHENSIRCFGPFIEINCAAAGEALLESRLSTHFGDERMFPSRHDSHKCTLADGGTLLVKEISKAPPSVLATLLRALKLAAHNEMGKQQGVVSDFRLVLSSRTSLDDGLIRELSKGRSSGGMAPVKVKLPALRERVGDVPVLAHYFLGVFSARYRRNVTAIAPAAMRALVRHHWPGNIRELRNVMERSVVLTLEETMRPENLPASVTDGRGAEKDHTSERHLLPLKVALREPERQYIISALEKTGGNKQLAAKKLRISRSTLYKKIKQHGLAKNVNMTSRSVPHEGEWITVFDTEGAE